MASLQILQRQAINDINAGMPIEDFDRFYPELKNQSQVFRQYYSDKQAGMPKNEAQKFYPELFETTQKEIKMPKEVQIMETVAEKGLGGALKAVGKATDIYGKAVQLPFVRLPFQAVGAATGALGGAIGGITGAVGETMKQAIQAGKGKGFNIRDIVKSTIEQAKETGKFGFNIGKQAAEAAPLLAMGAVPTAIMGAAEIQKGTELLEKGEKKEAFTRAGLGAAQLIGAPFIKGKLIEKSIIERMPFPKLSKTENQVLDIVIDKAIKPSVTSVKTQTARNNYYQKGKEAFRVIDEYKPIFKGEELPRNPKNQAELLEGINQAKKTIYKEYDDIAKKSGEKGALFKTQELVDDLEKIKNDVSYSPELRKYAEKQKIAISELEGQSPSVIQKRIEDYNSSLVGYYAGRVDKAKTQLDASMAYKMRQQLDDLITNTTGVNYQAIKNKYGTLKTIENDLSRQVTVQARKNTKGFFDITDVFTGSDITAGVVTLNPSLILRGIAGRGIKEYIKWLNNPDRWIQKAFKIIENNKIKSTKTGIPPRILNQKALPPPSSIPLEERVRRLQIKESGVLPQPRTLNYVQHKEVRTLEGIKETSLLGTPREYSKVLTLEEKQIELAAFNNIDKNKGSIILEYEKQHGKLYNPDDFRELVHDSILGKYDGTKAYLVQEPASEITKYAVKQEMENTKLDDIVIMTSGGAGSGKTTAIKLAEPALFNKKKWGLDSVMGKFDKARDMIDSVLKKGGKIYFPYVLRDIEKAWFDGVVKRAIEKGRTVSLKVFLEGTEASNSVVKKIYQLYKNNKKVIISLLDNRIEKGMIPKKMTLEELDKIDMTNLIDKLYNKLYKETEQMYKKGKITKEIQDGLLKS